MTDLRKEAMGRECFVQLWEICNHDPATVVLHHLRKTGLTRDHDKFGLPVCSACHAAIHRQTNQDLEYNFLRYEQLEGWLRWLVVLEREGKLGA